jgi:hypothetical protein
MDRIHPRAGRRYLGPALRTAFRAGAWLINPDLGKLEDIDGHRLGNETERGRRDRANEDAFVQAGPDGFAVASLNR